MRAGDHARVAEIWHEGWHDAHDGLVPDALSRLRTPDAFRKAVPKLTRPVRVGLTEGGIGGFVAWQDDGIDYLFLARAVRGTGLAQALMARAEAEIAAAGHTVARIDHVEGNARAARFYAREGWRRIGHEDERWPETGDSIGGWRSILLEKRL
ncbi:GNAT family N-acetyltransferase [Psychromarinibacter sp. C21-152]|uniref:GNAT family N-acetyltransferase n=2 Tax=Psychromarinibacter sediminicola TaxID=3033385 RepID=A0AAE3NVG6_9RHOB|nr:GNAT family N-acetyltransferase [Psychromarinibacter sediminicola]